MDIVEEYRKQAAWRSWPAIFAALPPVDGKTVLDLGCGIGDQSAELAARGACVIGLDAQDELLAAARSRGLPHAEFRLADLHRPLDPAIIADGLWASFSPAYFTDLGAALARWLPHIRPDGWIALTEIDDLFGHEPLSVRARSLFDAYAADSLSAGRYDFHMGRKLRSCLERARCTVTTAFSVPDQEFSFDGPARPDVLEAWRRRLTRMALLRDRAGSDWETIADEFLGCLQRPDHRSLCKVCFVLARKQISPRPSAGSGISQ